MKFLKLSFLAFILLFIVSGIKSQAFALDPFRPLCVGITGKFVATNWTGGPIQVGCVGDDGGATNDPAQRCTGQIITGIRPGNSYRLTKCSCWGGTKGCLKVGKELRLNPLDSNNHKTITVVKSIKEMTFFQNNSCTVNSAQIANYCAANGSHLTGKNVVIKCEALPTNTPTRNPSHTPTPTINPSNTPTPTSCVGPDKVTNIHITCPNCANPTNSNNGPIGEVDEGNGCIRRSPLLVATGPTSKTVDRGETVGFDVKITNRDSAACTQRGFSFEHDWDNNNFDWFVDGKDQGLGYVLQPGASIATQVTINAATGLSTGAFINTIVNAWDGDDSAASRSNSIILKATVN